MKKSVLFLGYDKSKTILIDELSKKGCKVFHSKDSLDQLKLYDLIISFGYRHIIKKEFIEKTNIPIINLHISYLPWNRGAHPNFWSFYEGTPTGVSIHMIDSGIDTGAIIDQKIINFEINKQTFKDSYKILIEELENLFIKNIDKILNKDFKAIKQRHQGTFHLQNELPKSFRGWDEIIEKEIKRLKIIEKSIL